jgi:hypothetical protein
MQGLKNADTLYSLRFPYLEILLEFVLLCRVSIRDSCGWVGSIARLQRTPFRNGRLASDLRSGVHEPILELALRENKDVSLYFRGRSLVP